MIVDDHAADAVREYNRSGLHFHLVAEAIYRFRYQIYVDEMGKRLSYADHEQRMLYDPLDQTAGVPPEKVMGLDSS